MLGLDGQKIPINIQNSGAQLTRYSDLHRKHQLIAPQG